MQKKPVRIVWQGNQSPAEVGSLFSTGDIQTATGQSSDFWALNVLYQAEVGSGGLQNLVQLKPKNIPRKFCKTPGLSVGYYRVGFSLLIIFLLE